MKREIWLEYLEEVERSGINLFIGEWEVEEKICLVATNECMGDRFSNDFEA